MNYPVSKAFAHQETEMNSRYRDGPYYSRYDPMMCCGIEPLLAYASQCDFDPRNLSKWVLCHHSRIPAGEQ